LVESDVAKGRSDEAQQVNEEQIIGILKEQEAGLGTGDLCRNGISNATFYKWKAKYGGLEVSEARRLSAQAGLRLSNKSSRRAAHRRDFR
jgi:hypothetical protein